ncbi:MAG TPA: hypothetical protein DCS93_07385 [Microscillaceae bacterium]|nr:hypothetical protein [Microscillaceae bacterium]
MMKRLGRIFKYLIVSLLAIILVVFVLLLLDNDYQSEVKLDVQQLPTPRKIHTQAQDASQFQQLKAKFGKNKILPKGYELQALIALSHYPELKEIPIKFMFQEAYIPLSSRPDPATVLLPWRKRTYLVVISTKSVKAFESILFKNLPYNGQIGVIGHELAHTVSYLDKSALQIARIGFKYATSAVYQKSFERATDLRTIRHGLGYQLRSMSEDILNKIKRIPALAKEVGQTKENYYTPQEITQQIAKMPELYSKVHQ